LLVFSSKMADLRDPLIRLVHALVQNA
jgi:hypothetical protein